MKSFKFHYKSLKMVKQKSVSFDLRNSQLKYIYKSKTHPVLNIEICLAMTMIALNGDKFEWVLRIWKYFECHHMADFSFIFLIVHCRQIENKIHVKFGYLPLHSTFNGLSSRKFSCSKCVTEMKIFWFEI